MHTYPQTHAHTSIDLPIKSQSIQSDKIKSNGNRDESFINSVNRISSKSYVWIDTFIQVQIQIQIQIDIYI
jgi:hypothetical protein